MTSYTFLRSVKDPLPPNLANVPISHMTHQSFIVGDRVIKPNIDITMESGYQVCSILWDKLKFHAFYSLITFELLEIFI